MVEEKSKFFRDLDLGVVRVPSLVFLVLGHDLRMADVEGTGRRLLYRSFLPVRVYEPDFLEIITNIGSDGERQTGLVGVRASDADINEILPVLHGGAGSEGVVKGFPHVSLEHEVIWPPGGGPLCLEMRDV